MYDTDKYEVHSINLVEHLNEFRMALVIIYAVLSHFDFVAKFTVNQVVSLALPHCNRMPYWHYQLVLSLV